MVRASVLAFCLIAVAAARAAEPSASTASPSTEASIDLSVQLAARAARAEERDEAAWRQLTENLARAVESYRPELSIDALPEEAALQAFRRYCKELLASGRAIAELVEQRDGAGAALIDTLRKSPAYYNAASARLRERSRAMQNAGVRAKYELAAEVWEQLAARAETRAKALRLDEGVRGLAELIREENSFLEDFLATLEALPRPTGAVGTAQEDLLAKMRQHAARTEEMQTQLRRFRDRLRTDPATASPADEHIKQQPVDKK